MILRQTSLSKNVVQFCRFLRQHGFTIGVTEETTTMQALSCIDYSNNDVFRLALRSVLCRSQTQLHEFDNLFQQYWKELEKAVEAKTKKDGETKKPANREASFKAVKSWLHASQNKEREETASYSVQEKLSQKDFSVVPAEDLDELSRMIKVFSRRLAVQLSRRYEQSHRVNLPDLRRTLRYNMRRGGELLDLYFRKPKRNRTRLVVLCDMSQSMDLYSVFLLQFMYAFQQVYSRMESFAFGTSLQYLTPLLKGYDFTQAMRRIGVQGESWGGGTRIGESLQQFVKDYASHMLNRRTIVLILSDGWDTAETEKLRQSMETIKALSKKIIWLNPLAGFSEYRPETAALKAALPYVDMMAPVHNVESLRKLGQWL